MAQIKITQKSLYKVMQKRKSKNKAISMQDLAIELGVSERSLRIIIEDARERNIFGKEYLVSNHEVGYWLSSKADEIDEWLKGYLGKAARMFKVAKIAVKLSSHKKQMEIANLFNTNYENGNS